MLYAATKEFIEKTTMQEYCTLTWSFFSLSRLKKVGLNLLVLQIPKFNPLKPGCFV